MKANSNSLTIISALGCLLYILISPVSSFAQRDAATFILRGDVSSISGASMVYLSGVDIRDSARVTHGKFVLKGRVNQPQQVTLLLKRSAGVNNPMSITKKDRFIFFLSNTQMLLKATYSLGNSVITGSKLQDQYNAYYGGLIKIYDKKRPLNMSFYEYEDQNNQEMMQVIRKKLNILDTIEFDYVTGFVKKNPKSPVALYAVREFAKPILNPPDFGSAFQLLDPSLKKTRTGEQIQKLITDASAYKLGDMMPEFIQPDTDGKSVKLSDFRGKYVLVDFWASWCGPCRKEIPNIKRAFNQYKHQNFMVLSVSLDDSAEKWKTAIAEEGIQEFIQVGDMKGRANVAAMLLKVSSIPQNFLIDPSGKIIAKNIHNLEFDSTIERLFK